MMSLLFKARNFPVKASQVRQALFKPWGKPVLPSGKWNGNPSLGLVILELI